MNRGEVVGMDIYEKIKKYCVSAPSPIKEVLAEMIKQNYLSDYIPDDTTIKVGSGGEFVNDAINLKFDALLTADIKHHQFLIAKDNNVSLFDGGHFNTEDIIVEVLAQTLKNNFKEIEFSTFHSEIIKFA